MSGWKTYSVAAALCAFAFTGLATGKIDGNHALELILEALALMGLRHAIATEAKAKT